MSNAEQETEDKLVIPEDVAEWNVSPNSNTERNRRKRKRRRRRNRTKREHLIDRDLEKYNDMPQSLRRPIVDNGNAGICQQIIDNIRDSMREDT